MPYVLVGDEAFPLKSNLMRPFPGRAVPGVLTKEQQIYNYRLSRARRIIENTFGILVAKWRIFKSDVIAIPRKIELYVKATVVLHNFLQKAEQNIAPEERQYCPPGFADGDEDNGKWRKIIESEGGSALTPITRMGSNNHTRSAAEIRDKFSEYFVSRVGAVSWQEAKINRGK